MLSHDDSISGSCFKRCPDDNDTPSNLDYMQRKQRFAMCMARTLPRPMLDKPRSLGLASRVQPQPTWPRSLGGAADNCDAEASFEFQESLSLVLSSPHRHRCVRQAANWLKAVPRGFFLSIK